MVKQDFLVLSLDTQPHNQTPQTHSALATHVVRDSSYVVAGSAGQRVVLRSDPPTKKPASPSLLHYPATPLDQPHSPHTTLALLPTHTSTQSNYA